MCYSLPKNTVLLGGLALSIVFGVLNIICIIVTWIDYSYTDFKWTTIGPWRHTAELEVSVVVIIFAIFFFGVLVFTVCHNNKVIQIIFVIVEGMATWLALSISIFSFCAARVSRNEFTLTCRKNQTGIFEYFRSIDNIMNWADRTWCSDKCPCYITEDSTYERLSQNPNNVFTDNLSLGATNIESCKGDAFSSFYVYTDNLNNIGRFDPDTFISFWARIERKFKCTGWCEMNYSHNGENRTIDKYLFSDINYRGGEIKHYGCIKRWNDWIPKLWNTFGSVLWIVSTLMIGVFVFAVSLCGEWYVDSDNDETSKNFNKIGTEQKHEQKDAREWEPLKN